MHYSTRRVLLAALWLMASFHLIACNKSSNGPAPDGVGGDTGNPTESISLTGTWKSVCLRDSENNTMYDYTFGFGSVQNERVYPVTETNATYPAGSNCQGSGTSVDVYTGNATIGTESASVAGATELDIVIPATGSYGAQADYTIFKIENGLLYFGESEFGTFDGSSPAKRYRKLNFNLAFTKLAQ